MLHPHSISAYFNCLVNKSEYLWNYFIYALVYIIFVDELNCNLLECILWPAHKPINHRVVDDGWISSTVISEVNANWRHS